MAMVPRILRSLPHGPISRPGTSVPVIARLRWANGQQTDVSALAVAWTYDSVEIRWEYRGESRTDWISATDVRNQPEPPTPEERLPAQPRVRAVSLAGD